MFDNDYDNENLNEFLNDEKISSDTEKILGAVSKIEAGIISAVAGFFENLSFVEETQSIEDAITFNASNIINEFYSLKETILNLPSLKNQIDASNSNHNEVIKKLDNIIEKIKSNCNYNEIEDNNKLQLNLNDALIPLGEKLSELNNSINEIGLELKTNKNQSDINIVENTGIIESINNLNQNFNDIKNLININENSEIIESINNLNQNENGEIIESINNLNQNFNDIKNLININENSEIIESINNLNQNFNDIKNVVNIQQDEFNHSLTTISQKINDVHNIINNSENTLENEKVIRYLNFLSKNISEVKNILNNIDITTGNNVQHSEKNNELIQSLNILNQNITEIKSSIKNNDIDTCQILSNDIKNLIKAIEVNEDIYNNQTQSDIFEILNVLNHKISLITHTSIDDDIDNVESLFNQIKIILTSIQNIEENQNSFDFKEAFESLKEKLPQISSAINNLKEQDVAYCNKINSNIAKLSLAIEKVLTTNTNHIQDEIKQVKDTIIEAVAGFFQNFNFIEEQENILNAYNENKNEINEKISQTYIKLDEKLTPLASNIGNIEVLKDSINRINDVFSKSSNELDDNLNGYKYTFIDLENDIIKINMLLNDFLGTVSQNLDENKQIIKSELSNVSNIVEEFKNDNSDFIKSELSNVSNIIEEFKNDNSDFIKSEITNLTSVVESTNEDISSISKRTNKLIILADEAQNTFSQNIEHFKNLVSQIVNHINNLIKLNNEFSNLVKNENIIISSINNINEAFIYLGNWIDSTDIIFKDILKNLESNVKSEDLNLVRISLEDRLNNIENVISNVDNSIHDMSLKLNSYEEISLNVEDKIGSFDEVFDNITASINDNNFKVNNLSEQIADVENSFNNNLMSRLDKVNETIEELQTSYEETNNLINEKIENIQNKMNKSNDYDEKLDEILEKLKQNEQKNIEISKQLEEKDHLFEQINQEMDGVRKLNAKVISIEDIISRLDKKITRIVDYIDED